MKTQWYVSRTKENHIRNKFYSDFELLKRVVRHNLASQFYDQHKRIIFKNWHRFVRKFQVLCSQNLDYSTAATDAGLELSTWPWSTEPAFARSLSPDRCRDDKYGRRTRLVSACWFLIARSHSAPGDEREIIVEGHIRSDLWWSWRLRPVSRN